MAPHSTLTLLPAPAIFLMLSIAMFPLGIAISAVDFECEELPLDNCAFAVSHTGTRCVLETNILKDGTIQLECQTSKIVTDSFRSWIEDNKCIQACGLNRMSVGLSSDFLGEHELQRSICGNSCLEECPNVVEIFTNLASGEGVGLQELCQLHRVTSRKLIQASMLQVASNVAESPK